MPPKGDMRMPIKYSHLRAVIATRSGSRPLARAGEEFDGGKMIMVASLPITTIYPNMRASTSQTLDAGVPEGAEELLRHRGQYPRATISPPQATTPSPSPSH